MTQQTEAPAVSMRAIQAATLREFFETLSRCRAELLDLPLAEGDRTLLGSLQPLTESGIGGGPARRDFAAAARQQVTKLMQTGRCSIANVARGLAVSPRTLQRRLEREGTTFGAVCDEARCAVALDSLKNPKTAIKEAAFLAGFSEPSTFYRAFRRWTGATPASYRRSLTTLVA